MTLINHPTGGFPERGPIPGFIAFHIPYLSLKKFFFFFFRIKKTHDPS